MSNEAFEHLGYVNATGHRVPCCDEAGYSVSLSPRIYIIDRMVSAVMLVNLLFLLSISVKYTLSTIIFRMSLILMYSYYR